MGKSRRHGADISSKGLYWNQSQSTMSGIMKLPSTTIGEKISEETKKKSRKQRRKDEYSEQENAYYMDLEEVDEMDEHVFYSLNKKQRWNLPEKIRNEIKLGRHAADVGLNVTGLHHDTSLVERHCWKRGSNCTSLRSTNLSVDTPNKSSKYLNSNSILMPHKTKRRKSKRKSEQTEEIYKPQLPCVQVEVYYGQGIKRYTKGKDSCIHKCSRNSRELSLNTVTVDANTRVVHVFGCDGFSQKEKDSCIHKSTRNTRKLNLTKNSLNAYRREEYERGCEDGDWWEDEQTKENAVEKLPTKRKKAVSVEVEEEILRPSFFRDYVKIVLSSEDAEDRDEERSESSWEIVTVPEEEEENGNDPETVEPEFYSERESDYGISEWLSDAFERRAHC